MTRKGLNLIAHGELVRNGLKQIPRFFSESAKYRRYHSTNYKLIVESHVEFISLQRARATDSHSQGTPSFRTAEGRLFDSPVI